MILIRSDISKFDKKKKQVYVNVMFDEDDGHPAEIVGILNALFDKYGLEMLSAVRQFCDIHIEGEDNDKE